MDKNLRKRIHWRLERVIDKHLVVCGHSEGVEEACEYQANFEVWLQDQIATAWSNGALCQRPEQWGEKIK